MPLFLLEELFDLLLELFDFLEEELPEDLFTPEELLDLLPEDLTLEDDLDFETPLLLLDEELELLTLEEPLLRLELELLFTEPEERLRFKSEPTLLLVFPEDELPLFVTFEDLTLEEVLVLESILLPLFVTSDEDLLLKEDPRVRLSFFWVNPLLLGPYE